MTGRVRLALVALVIALLAVTMSRMDLRAVTQSLARMSWRWALAAAAVNLLGVTIDAARWQIVVSAITPVSFFTVCYAFVVGIAGNVVFPFKLGEGARAYVLATRTELRGATALTTVLLDRVIDVATLPLFVTLAGVLLPLPESIVRYRPWMMAVGAVSVGAAAVGRVWIRRRQRHSGTIQPPPVIDRIADGLRLLDHHHRLAAAVGIALCSWSARGAIVWCMFQAFGLRLPVSAAVGTLAMINLGIAVVAMPGNLGTFELVTAGALGLWGVKPADGLSLGVAMHVLEVVPPALLGAAAIVSSRGKLARSSAFAPGATADKSGRGSAW